MLGAGQSVNVAFFLESPAVKTWENNVGQIGILHYTCPRQDADELVGGRVSLHSFSLSDISSRTCFEIVCSLRRGG